MKALNGQILQQATCTRYHTFKLSQKYLLIADSQGRFRSFPDFNIVSLPGGKMDTSTISRHLLFNTIYCMFHGRKENDLDDGDQPSTAPSEDIAHQF